MKVLFLILLFLVLCPALYFYCIMPRFTRKEQTKRFAHQLFAHRGLFNPKLGIPENSMPAFSRAIEKGYGIELDVQITKDNRIVVFHDYSLGRMCGIDIPLETKTYAELQELCLQNTRETIPLLSDVLKLVNGQVPLLVEIKLHSFHTYPCALVDQLLQEYHGSYCIESFNSLALLWYRRHRPEVVRGQLSSNLTNPGAEGGFLLSFLVKHLLINCIGRPDFIAYSYKDYKNLSFTLNKCLYKTPVFAWTLRSPETFEASKKRFDSFIFDSFIPKNE